MPSLHSVKKFYKETIKPIFTEEVEPIHICITGAAGQVAYHLVYLIASGDVFGKHQPLILKLLDLESAMNSLTGLQMELEDCAFPLLKETVITSDPNVAFNYIDYAILAGSAPRKQGMTSRKDLLQSNVEIFKRHGEALDHFAKKTAKIIVIGNPVNTNCCVLMHYAPTIPRSNFSALTRLDQNRATALIAKQLKVSPDRIKNVSVWGNHSSTQFPDISNAFVTDYPNKGDKSALENVIPDKEWLRTTFVKTIQERGTAVMNARNQSSAISAAKAAKDHLRCLFTGTDEGVIVSMAVESDGSYNVPAGLIFSFPVTIKKKTPSIVQGLYVDAFARTMLDATANELTEEKNEAMSIIQSKTATSAPA